MRTAILAATATCVLLAGVSLAFAQAQTQPHGGVIPLTAEQRAQMRASAFEGAPRANNVNFPLSVGAVVPRSIRIMPVPPILVQLHPGWRGYMYFMAGDEMIIVEPGTHRIVAVIPV